MTRVIKLKNTAIGGGNRILVQSMLNADTLSYDCVIKQIDELVDEGCDIIRLAVENAAAVEICKKYLEYSPVPLIADIQFDYKLAILCSEIGFPKIRFNPGNVGGENRVREIIRACKANKTAVRIGVNSGSLEKALLEKHRGLTGSGQGDILNGSQDLANIRAQAIVESALKSLRFVEAENFSDVVLSVKSSDIMTMVTANRIMSKSCDYPLHIGVTESGMGESGIIKSAIGIGALLLDGIGDTIRVSLTGDPCAEVRAAKSILKALGLLDLCEIISCPTCSRCKCDLECVVKEAETLTKGINKKLKIAIMGCAVNGPGEAADADFGVAFGKENAIIFENGRNIKSVAAASAIDEIKAFLARYR